VQDDAGCFRQPLQTEMKSGARGEKGKISGVIARSWPGFVQPKDFWAVIAARIGKLACACGIIRSARVRMGGIFPDGLLGGILMLFGLYLVVWRLRAFFFLGETIEGATGRTGNSSRAALRWSCSRRSDVTAPDSFAAVVVLIFASAAAEHGIPLRSKVACSRSCGPPFGRAVRLRTRACHIPAVPGSEPQWDLFNNLDLRVCRARSRCRTHHIVHRGKRPERHVDRVCPHRPLRTIRDAAALTLQRPAGRRH